MEKKLSFQKYYDEKWQKSKIPPKKKSKFVLQRGRETILQVFIANSENEDSDDIFEKIKSESEDGEEHSYENVDIENVHRNIESNAIETIDKPVYNNANKNNNRHANVNID